MPRALIFDFETYPIVPGVAHPPAVCMSYEWVDVDAWRWITDWSRRLTNAAVTTWREGVALLRATLEDGETLLVGQETAFDAWVSAYNADEPERMAALWCYAYERNRVVDVALRQALYERAVDSYQKDYRLDAICKRTTGQVLDKSNLWRLRFGVLDGLPVNQYPREAYSYALEDATGTAGVFLWQESRRAEGSPYFPGYDVLADQYRQAYYSLAIKDLSSYGLRSNPETVAAFTRQVQGRRAELRAKLLAAGIVAPRYTIVDSGVAAYAESVGKPLPKTKSGAPSRARRAILATGDETLGLLLQWPPRRRTAKHRLGAETTADYLARIAPFERDVAPRLLSAGLAKVDYSKATDTAGERLKAAFERRGLPVPYTTPAKKKRGETAEKYASRIAEFQPSVKLDNDSCTKSGDEALLDYAEYSSLDTICGSPLHMMTVAATQPFHAHYRSLQKTGRTSTGSDGEGAKGNVQNPHRKPGVREAYEPRQASVHPDLAGHLDEDHVYVDGDFAAVELHTFSQICYWVVGWSVLGDKLNSGFDVHLEVAADIEGISYAEAQALKKAKDPRISESRTAGKAVNFGRKGAMGEAKFELAAWNNYKVDVSKIPGGAARLMQLHDARTPEFPLYSQWVQSHAREPGRYGTKFDLVMPYSGRLNAGLLFTDAHNYPFQGLASDVAKLALVYVMKARWGLSELGRDDPLYQCGSVLFVHDSITCEVRRSNAFDAAHRLRELMFRAACVVLPQCPSPIEPAATMHLSKKTDPVVKKDPTWDREAVYRVEPDGRVSWRDSVVGIWDVFSACEKDGRSLLDDPKSGVHMHNVTESLRKNQWPEYAIAKAVERLAACAA